MQFLNAQTATIYFFVFENHLNQASTKVLLTTGLWTPFFLVERQFLSNQVAGSQMPAIGFCKASFKPQVQPQGNKPGLQMILLHVCYSTLAQLTCLKKSNKAKENISFCTSGNWVLLLQESEKIFWLKTIYDLKVF